MTCTCNEIIISIFYVFMTCRLVAAQLDLQVGAVMPVPIRKESETPVHRNIAKIAKLKVSLLSSVSFLNHN